MSDGQEGRDSENNWVIPSAESFPVETVGAAQGGAEEVGAAGLGPAPPPDGEETAPDVKPGTEFAEGPTLHEKPEEPEKLDEEQGPPSNTEGPRGPGIVGGDLEEVSCSSSDDDVEGLRKRVGRGTPPASVGPSVREAVEQDLDGGSSLNLNVLVIAAVGLLCLGVLLFSGSSFSSDDDPPQNVVSRSVTGGEERPPQVIADIQDWIEQHADQFTGDPSSLQLMSGLLDRVAKENQEIRHMQATLQAQKEELEALLSVSDGRNITPGLADENIRLKDALLKEETAHLSAKEELLNVQEKLEVLESGGVEKEALVVENSQMKVDLDALRQQIEGFLAQKETLVAESQMLRQELDKQRLLVTSIRQELDNLVAKSDEGEDRTLLQERLSEMSSRLAMEAQRSETWEKKYVEHAQRRKEQVVEERRDHGYKEWKRVDKSNISTPGGDFRKTHYKHVKEHGKRWTEDTHPESQHEERRSKKHDDKHWQDKKHRHGEKTGAEIQGDKENWKSKSREHRSKESAHHHHDHHEKQARHHQGEAEAGFHPRKGQKDFTDSHKRREDKEHRHHDHNKFWKKLSDHQYRVPEGCSGLEDCARKDGVDLFNMELKPVQRKQFEEVLLNYLTKSQLSDHLPELTPLLDGFFEGPLFSHHKIRFKDFVDDVEDFLEDLARKEMGNDDIVDDFERYVYTSFFGEGVPKKRCAKDEQQKTSKCHKQYGQLEKTYDQSINQSNDNKPFTTDLHVHSHDFKPIKKHKAHENDKFWSPNSQLEEESDHKYHNKDHPITHHQSPKHNKHDKNDGSFHRYGHHSEKKPRYPHIKPGGEAGGQHPDGQHFHNIQYKEYGAWQMQNHDKQKYDPQNHRHQNTNKEQKVSDERFGKGSFKFKHKSPEKHKEDEDSPKKQEKDAHNNHYQSFHTSHDDHSTDHKSLRDGNQQHRQTDTFHKNDHGPTQRYLSKAYNHKHKENKGRPGDYHPHQHDVHDRHRNYHQKHGKEKHGNYHQLHERSKDSDGDYHKYDKDPHKHEDDRDYHHKYDKDHHKHEDDRDYHHKYDKDHHKHEDDRDYHHKYDKDHHKHEDDRDYHHKYDKDHHKHEDDRDYHHKYRKDHHKHEDDRDYHHKYDKDHHKHEDDRDYHHKYDKDHHKHEDDRDYHHKYDEDHHKHKDDRDYNHKYDKDHHKHEDDKDYHHKYDKDHHKRKEGKDKHGNFRYRPEEERRLQDYQHDDPRKY
ncbi:pre-B-cell leukemia transcription factor-interacting protein 1 isoform X3 [Bufo gargarizans]|uniref:pre-B-cell leukemia transcription factor-interacting protein 1 isoform X3 n=1 Tax=Bufo gargarizans TaxID=30331 RepID=UPI001CF168B7|nr:pre-B-cell leukemia transcription factor-interacting protein 1 isoform X3 [Bufo gargarizans]